MPQPLLFSETPFSTHTASITSTVRAAVNTVGLCTFAIVTTEANRLLAEVHKTKDQMPTILPQPQAYDWLFKPLSYEQIRALATYQFPSELMEGWPVGKDFLTNPEARQKVTNVASSSILSLF